MVVARAARRDVGAEALTLECCVVRCLCRRAGVQIKGNTIYCANAGDSRGVLCRAGKAINLSDDHKPMDPIEKARIEKANGFVEDKRCARARACVRICRRACVRACVRASGGRRFPPTRATEEGREELPRDQTRQGRGEMSAAIQ